MNSVLIEIYSTVAPSAPYIIAAYGLLLVALFVYVFVIQRSMKKAEAQITVLEEALAEKMGTH